jgi:hypothetical protein
MASKKQDPKTFRTDFPVLPTIASLREGPIVEDKRVLKKNGGKKK